MSNPTLVLITYQISNCSPVNPTSFGDPSNGWGAVYLNSSE